MACLSLRIVSKLCITSKAIAAATRFSCLVLVWLWEVAEEKRAESYLGIEALTKSMNGRLTYRGELSIFSELEAGYLYEHQTAQ